MSICFPFLPSQFFFLIFHSRVVSFLELLNLYQYSIVNLDLYIQFDLSFFYCSMGFDKYMMILINCYSIYKLFSLKSSCVLLLQLFLHLLNSWQPLLSLFLLYILSHQYTSTSTMFRHYRKSYYFPN